MNIKEEDVKFRKNEMNIDIKNKITIPWALCDKYKEYNALEIQKSGTFSTDFFGNNIYFFYFDDGCSYNKHANYYTKVPDIYVS